jgi:hypothetical protein
MGALVQQGLRNNDEKETKAKEDERDVECK